MLRLGCLVVLVTALAAALASTALADADPASDVLYVRDVFVPFSGVSPAAAAELRKAAKDSRAGGMPIKVAVIATRRDLGGVPSLYGNPLYYARFLGSELTFLYSGRLLVVMPQGAALSERGRLVANQAVLHAKIEPGPDGLVRTATALVGRLAGGSTGNVAQGGGTRSGGGGSPAWPWIVAGVAAAVVAAAAAVLLVRRRRRAA
ncbi:MAG TPA: hypothetical protein VFB35_08125 [Gaiellaceae bacterium]|nr:hypothetical protein [Gaiellaceae bacterium]